MSVAGVELGRQRVGGHEVREVKVGGGRSCWSLQDLVRTQSCALSHFCSEF